MVIWLVSNLLAPTEDKKPEFILVSLVIIVQFETGTMAKPKNTRIVKNITLKKANFPTLFNAIKKLVQRKRSNPLLKKFFFLPQKHARIVRWQKCS
jgi:hypothetical protein